MVRRLLIVAASVLVWWGFSEAVRAGGEKEFRAGAYAQNIDPEKYPVSVNGGMQDRQATKAADPLHARCLVLEDGNTRIAFVVVDSCMVPRSVSDAAKRQAHELTGIPPERILISATHAHSCPTLAGVFQSEPDAAYVEQLPRNIAAGIQEACKRMQPARIGWGVGKNPHQVFNRRWKMKSLQTDPFGRSTDQVRMNPGYLNKELIEPAGPIDPDVSFVSITTAQGEPLALLANYSLHYVGGVPSLSADYFGEFATRIGSLLGASKTGFVGILTNGTSGDINNINYGKEAPGHMEPYGQVRVVADSVARTVAEARKGTKHGSVATLAMVQREVELGVRLPSAKDVERAKAILAEAAAKGKGLRTLPEIYARETVLMSHFPPKVKALLQAIRIGDLAIVSTPCETFVEIGLELKKKSPFKHTFTIELANGYNGYLPTPEHHKQGGYETWRARSSYLAADASPIIVRNLLAMLAELKK